MLPLGAQSEQARGGGLKSAARLWVEISCRKFSVSYHWVETRWRMCLNRLHPVAASINMARFRRQGDSLPATVLESTPSHLLDVWSLISATVWKCEKGAEVVLFFYVLLMWSVAPWTSLCSIFKQCPLSTFFTPEFPQFHGLDVRCQVVHKKKNGGKKSQVFG